jgi:hypothetical protein
LADRVSPIQANYPIPEDFVALAQRLRPDAISVMLDHVWQGYDRLRQVDSFAVTQEDIQLEDEITAALHARIQDVMHESDAFSPFKVVHQPLEGEKQKDMGRPPQSDLGFRLSGGNVRSHFSIEAKLIRTDGAVSRYIKEISDNFLTGRYSTFSSEAAMLGYQLSGTAGNAFSAIGAALKCRLTKPSSFPNREHRCSFHQRKVGAAPNAGTKFKCHHLLMLFD